MYPEQIVTPCREELTSIGVEEMRTAEEVDNVLRKETGTTLVVVNSVCGCAAGGARPGVRLALEHSIVPDKITTVFAGVDREAVDQARTHMPGYVPSSPAIALFKDGELVFMMERHNIEGYQPDEIARALMEAFDTHCSQRS
jgi:putative YphP/YqiW family bacilliredoxin